MVGISLLFNKNLPFWASSLLKTVDFDQFRSLKLAGDYYLWKCFSTQEDLSVASCLFAGFRKQPGQLQRQKKPI